MAEPSASSTAWDLARWFEETSPQKLGEVCIAELYGDVIGAGHSQCLGVGPPCHTAATTRLPT